MTAAVIASLFPPDAAWIEPFIGAIAGIITLHIPDLCSHDPEPDPGLSGPDILSIIALGRGPLTQDAIDRYQQLVRRWAWLTFCQCSGGSTPSLGPFPTAPTGLPAINPPGVVGVDGGAPCDQDARTVSVLTTDTRRDIYANANCDAGGATCLSLAHPIPAGATAVQWHVSNSGIDPVVCTPGHNAFVTGQFANVSGSIGSTIFTPNVDSGTVSCINSVCHSNVIPIPTGATLLSLVAAQDGYAHATTFDVGISWFCGTGTVPITGAPVCCSASDPFTQGYLAQIMQLLTLIQRQLAPFAYVGGASHIGLTGNGVLTIPSLQGIKVTLTTQPGYVGEEFGSPLELFDVGWVAWGSPDGYLPREFISHNPQLSFPAKAEQYTRLGYSLNPGVVATIQELYAET